MLGIPIVTQFDGKGVKKAIASFKQLESTSAKVKFALKATAVASVAAFAAVGAAAVAATRSFFGFAKMARDDEKAAFQLASSIRASTKATDAQIASVEEWIDTVQRATGVADDELRPAYARLIRSTGSFEKAQRLLRNALDVSASTGKPLKTVVEALSRSYDGSNTALGKLGLGYEKAQLKAMSFNDIQKDLEKRFSGSALANAQTYEGTMARFSIAIQELKEALGKAVLPYLKKLADYGTRIATAFGQDGVAGALAELKFILKNLLYDDNGELNQVGKTLNEIADKWNLFSSIFNTLGKGVSVSTALPRAVVGAFTDTPTSPSVGRVGNLNTTINPGELRQIRGRRSGANVTVNVGIGDPVVIGRQVYNALNAYERRGGR